MNLQYTVETGDDENSRMAKKRTIADTKAFIESDEEDQPLQSNLKRPKLEEEKQQTTVGGAQREKREFYESGSEEEYVSKE